MRFSVLLLCCLSTAHALTFEQLNDQGIQIQKQKNTILNATQIKTRYQFTFPDHPASKITVQAVALKKNQQIQNLEVLGLGKLAASQGETVFNALLRMASLCLNFGPSAVSMDHMTRAPSLQNKNLKFSKIYGTVKVSYQIQQGKLTHLSYQRMKSQPASCTL